ncbi:phosphotransferase family protein [Candidatus Poriferisodalis sp.]|uniref:phosphotransferase family protein n=1 Tax=Candidatus Poriferisodalis sp. TaxID=3101277 RepID=UPI003B010D0F
MSGGEMPDGAPDRAGANRATSSPEAQGAEATAAVVGYDVPAVEAWISENVDGLEPPFAWTQLEGGHSNLTYKLKAGDGTVAVVRRPPMGDLLPKAHDMGREFTIISGLGPTDVPVAAAYGYCESPEVTGAHFYVMSYVEGRPLFASADAREHLTAAGRANVGTSFMDVLAALHSVDPLEAGLGELGKPEDYVGRQIRTWYRSWTASADAAQYDTPVVHELHDFLAERKPQQGPARVVHGDYGLHNCLFNPEGELQAVLDWEISTLGDPLADFAYALNGWAEPSDDILEGADPPTLVDGFVGRAELIERYQRCTGADLGQLQYYVSFNHWKSACIIHGVYARYMRGQKPADDVDLELYRARIGRGIELSAAAAATIS